MIELIHATKVYQKKKVVNNINATFQDGQITGIVGRNGSGKTVLFRMICGLTIPTEGMLIVNGEKIGEDVDFPSSLGAIIETPGFIGMESGLQNLMGLAALKKKIKRDEVIQAMERVGLDPFEKKSVRKYSLGMRQRLGIAQAIMEDPDVLVLDEPTNGLDNDGAREIRSLLLSLKEKGKTILVASHNREDISIMCDVVYRMDDGRLYEDSLKEEEAHSSNDEKGEQSHA